MFAGKSCYCLFVVDDNTGMTWPLFAPDRRDETTANAMRKWANDNSTIIKDHGGWDEARFDNAKEFTSPEVKQLMLEWGVKAEYTPFGGPKRNGKVERKVALVAEGAKAAWLSFPIRFPDVTFPAKALSYNAVWTEAFAYMADRLNITASAHAADKRCPWEKF